MTACVGGVGRCDARVGWIVPLFARDVRATEVGTADFVSVYLAGFVFAPLSIATGCIGLAGYAAYYWPDLETVWAHHDAALHIPWEVRASQLDRHSGNGVAVAICFFTVLLLYRRITAIGRLSKILWFGVMGTIGWVISLG